MFPQTKWWQSLLNQDGDSAPPEMTEDDMGMEATRDDPQYLQLMLKKKHQTNLLKRMLAEGGYPELAKMTTIRRGGEPERDF